MPRFRVRLEDGEGEFRLTSLRAEDEDAARVACERMEHQRAAYQLTPDTLSEFEGLEAADDKTPGDARWGLVVHRQTKPYEVVSVEKVS